MTTTTTAVAGPAFPIVVKLLASALMLALVGSGTAALHDHRSETPLTLSGIGFLLAVAAVIGSGYWGILTSRTRVDGESIEQTWLWRKRVRLAEITQLKLLSIPGLGWLIVPRLIVRTGFGLTTFHAGNPAVLACFRRLAYGEAGLPVHTGEAK